MYVLGRREVGAPGRGALLGSHDRRLRLPQTPSVKGAGGGGRDKQSCTKCAPPGSVNCMINAAARECSRPGKPGNTGCVARSLGNGAGGGTQTCTSKISPQTRAGAVRARAMDSGACCSAWVVLVRGAKLRVCASCASWPGRGVVLVRGAFEPAKHWEEGLCLVHMASVCFCVQGAYRLSACGQGHVRCRATAQRRSADWPYVHGYRHSGRHGAGRLRGCWW